jgi:hypothetical protein
MKSKRHAEKKKDLEQVLAVSAQVTGPVEKLHKGITRRDVDPG